MVQNSFTHNEQTAALSLLLVLFSFVLEYATSKVQEN
jgi:hypothetical protein